MSDDCLFCKIVKGEVPSKKVHEDERILAFEDIQPQAPTHTLIIPKKHIATLNEIEEADRDLLGDIVLVARKIAREKGLSEEGYRLVVNCLESAGQAVFHIHFHLLGGRTFHWPPG